MRGLGAALSFLARLRSQDGLDLPNQDLRPADREIVRESQHAEALPGEPSVALPIVRPPFRIIVWRPVQLTISLAPGHRKSAT